MRRHRPLKPVLAALAALAVVGCAPRPIIARDPVPPPAPGTAYVCDSFSVLFGQFYDTACHPAPPPPPSVVVRAKG